MFSKDKFTWFENPALNPPYLLFVFCFVFFPFLSLFSIKNCFPPRKGHFLYMFECLPLFLLSLFWPPPFWICYFSVFSLLLFFSSFLFFLFYFVSLFLFFSFLFFLLCFILFPCFCLFFPFFFFFAFVSWKEQHQNIQLQSSSSSIYFWGFLSCFLIEILFCLCFFLRLWYVFVQHQCIWLKKTQIRKHQFLVKKGVATKRFFFMGVCFAKCEKLSFFWPFFWQIVVDVQKHYKIGIQHMS